MRHGLVLVDIQNDYFKGGKFELVNSEQAVLRAQSVLNTFRDKGWPIYHVRHISLKPNATFFLPNTDGCEFYNAVSPLPGEEIIIKHRPDSFLGTNLKEKLEHDGIDMLVICGMMTHMCIDTTVRSANGYGYPVTLVEDACATRDLVWNDSIIPAEQVHNAYMAALNGSFANVQTAHVWINAHK